MDEARRGILAMIGAGLIWGLAPIYYKALAHIGPFEVVAHRTAWSFLFFALVLAVQGRAGLMIGALRGFGAPVLGFAACLIAINWLLFIWSVQNARATEASLGYFIFPLVAVLLGRLFFGERLARGQGTAIALVVGGVAVLTLGLGAAPWIALVLATSFGLYGLVKKRFSIGPTVSVTVETLILTPPALIWLALLHTGPGGVFGTNLHDTVMLAFSGPITALPLILFSYATRRISLATVGLLQYINPTLQFLVAVAIFGEPFGLWHGIAFGLIWLALAIYSVAALRQDRAARSARSSVGTSGTEDTSPASEGSAKPSAMT